MASSRFSLKRLIGMALGIYLVCDAATHGPLRRAVSGLFQGEVSGLAARVHGRPITLSQLERALREDLWLQGKSPETLTPDQLKTARQAALDSLIDHALLRKEVADSPKPVQVSDDELNQRLRNLLGRFETKGHMQSAMKAQGIPGEPALRDRLAARAAQEKFLESVTAQAATVTEAEALDWFTRHKAELAIPERVEARHVFLPTLEQSPEEAKAKLETALADLGAGRKDFATLARELSGDPATKDKGGELGWLTRGRLPVDFSAPLFSLPLKQPTLVRTRLGWHLVEITNRKPAEERSFDDARAEVIAALQSVKRAKAVDAYRTELRRKHSAVIERFPLD